RIGITGVEVIHLDAGLDRKVSLQVGPVVLVTDEVVSGSGTTVGTGVTAVAQAHQQRVAADDPQMPVMVVVFAGHAFSLMRFAGCSGWQAHMSPRLSLSPMMTRRYRFGLEALPPEQRPQNRGIGREAPSFARCGANASPVLFGSDSASR